MEICNDLNSAKNTRRVNKPLGPGKIKEDGRLYCFKKKMIHKRISQKPKKKLDSNNEL